jgi:serine/threonine protein kinase
MNLKQCLEALHSTGVAHRDLSLENVMIHNDRAVIIDLGMSLQIPFINDRRALILPQGQAGKLKYMAPEVYANQDAFDGYAIDLWAVGVILYIMVVGEFPWAIPHPSDEKFRYITDGYLEDYLKRRGFPLSADILCLLQRMLWLNPRHRLCLQQVRAHPWMLNGQNPVNIIPFRSGKLKGEGEEGDVSREDMKEPTIVPPEEIPHGRYSGKEDGVPEKDMETMLEKVEPYHRKELRPEEEISPVEPTALSEEDPYVKALKEKMAGKAIPAQ